MAKCQKAKLPETTEKIFGVTKNGKCHYSFEEWQKGKIVNYDCIIPMKTAIGYAPTMLDVIDKDFKEANSEVASQRQEQNMEMIKIIHDYCKLRLK